MDKTHRARYDQVESGIYNYITDDEVVTYHERPFIKGQRTWRALGFNFARQGSLKNAREECHRRRQEVTAGAQRCASWDFN